MPTTDEIRLWDGRQVIDAMTALDLLGKVRREIYHRTAEFEQMQSQRNPPGMVEIRRRELLLAQEVIDMVRKEISSTTGGEPHE